jgi:tetratricopeptide (TPR) repeat protein
VDPIAALEQQAIDYARRGEFSADALRANEELTRLAPANQGAWTRLARCRLELGQLDEATAALESALHLNPQNTIARNLQIEVSKRREGPTHEGSKRDGGTARRRAPATPRARPSRENAPVGGGFGRPEFNALAHLAPQAAVEALGPRIEALLMAVNDRPFAEQIVSARNRAAQSGNRLFRRNSFHAADPGRIVASHYGGRWEPQLTIAFLAGRQWGRDAVAAGIGFNLSADEADPERETGPERASAYFDRFQRLASSTWRQLLIDWMGANGGFVQYADQPPATSLLPRDAVAWLTDGSRPRDAGWVFCGRWLFADRLEHAGVLADAAKLTRFVDRTFTDLLPLWMSVYRGN